MPTFSHEKVGRLPGRNPGLYLQKNYCTPPNDEASSRTFFAASGARIAMVRLQLQVSLPSSSRSSMLQTWVVRPICVGLAVAVSVQIVGALLVLSILVTPAAAAQKLSSSPVVVPLLSVLFAFVSLVGGIMLALGASVPISPYVTTISFLIYLVAAGVERMRVAREHRAIADAQEMSPEMAH